MSTKSFTSVVGALFALVVGTARADELTWTFGLSPNDIIAGPSLQKLRSRHHWSWEFNEQAGTFEIAVRKAVFPAASLQCRMDYLILSMPSYHHDTPKQDPSPNT
jgi:hypothetical protein